MNTVGEKVVRFADETTKTINCIISNTLINKSISEITREYTNVLNIYDTVDINKISTQIYNFYKNNVLTDEETDMNIYIFTSCINNKSQAIFTYEEDKTLGVGLECLIVDILNTFKDENIRYVNIFAIIKNVIEEGKYTINYNLRNIDAMNQLNAPTPGSIVSNVQSVILNGTTTFDRAFHIIRKNFKQSLKTGLSMNNGTELLKDIATKLNEDISQLSSIIY